MEESDLFEENRQLQFTIATLQSRISDLTAALYNQVGEDIRRIIREIPKTYHILCNNALLTVCEGLKLKFRDGDLLSKHQRERAQQRRTLQELHPTVYNRTHTAVRKGVIIRDFIIIHTFLKFICAESSETQHLPSLFKYHLSLTVNFRLLEKKLKLVSEIGAIDTPSSTDLLPPTPQTSSPPLELPSSIQSSSHSSTIAEHIEQPVSKEEIPIFRYFLNENGLQFLSTVLAGDEDILNVEAAKHNPDTTVCFLLCVER